MPAVAQHNNRCPGEARRRQRASGSVARPPYSDPFSLVMVAPETHPSRGGTARSWTVPSLAANREDDGFSPPRDWQHF
ncbi:hypothetical protein AAFF_G00423860 [Aldrovandia affinis]|uniref:Uncharacterized protein n=1 Tax=Aldrovandia affinis TaxID=143900 RepID=A0AAD7WZF6_9TELE|nr:hypothetical protein AAFF_G00423860 [Aldrovandia affinis]